MSVANRHTSIPGTGLPVTASTTVPEIFGVATWKGDNRTDILMASSGATFHMRKKSTTGKTTNAKIKYRHHSSFDRSTEASEAVMPH